MTVRVTRTFDVPIPIERAWNLLSDPEKRAEAISVVERYDVHDGDGREVTWHLSLPIPMVNRTISVRTRDVERDEPNYVKFTGTSRLMDVVGEHELTPLGDGTRIENRFRVESKVPGVERFFERNLDAELQNIEDALNRHIEE